MKSSGKRVSGDFLSVQHLVTAVSSVLSVWETEARRDQLSVLHQPNRNQNQRALERVVVTDEADGWIFSVIRPRTEKFLKTANLEDPKIFLLLIYFRQSSFLSCTWGHEAAVANHSCFRVEAGLTAWTSSWFITRQHRDKPSTLTLTPLVYLYTNLSGFICSSFLHSCCMFIFDITSPHQPPPFRPTAS